MRTKKLSSEDLDLLSFRRLVLGRDYCDQNADQVDALVNLPAAVALIEHETGKSIAPACWELTGDACDCEIRLPHGPVLEVLSFQYRVKGGVEEFTDYELCADATGDVAVVRPKSAWPWCACSTQCGRCKCPDWKFRVVYRTGDAGCLLPADPMLLRAVLTATEWMETHDETTWKAVQRLIEHSRLLGVLGE